MDRPTISYYNEAHDLAVNLDNMLRILSGDERFWAEMDKIIPLNNKDRTSLSAITAVDCYKCYRNSGISPNVLELKSLPILLSISLNVMNQDISISNLYSSSRLSTIVQSFINDQLVSLSEEIEKTEQVNNTEFIIALALHEYNTSLEKDYYRLMYTMSLLAIQTLPTISQEQSRWLASIFYLSL